MGSITELALEESQIRSILIRERYYRDTSQFDKMRKMYHPDGQKTKVYITWYEGDIDGSINGTRQVVKPTVNTVHAINPTEIDIRGSKALAESFCSMTSRFEHQGYEFDKVLQVRLISQLEKVHGEWKLMTLECIYIRDRIIPAAHLPRDAVVPSFDGVEKFRKSYRYATWLLGTIGLTVSDRLPAEDDHESVKEVLVRNRAWLDSN
ncbi:hypothetical protein PV11_06938 [Exophiala sideris]|uniref:SnoaL-like domain-containing protein n=1 Tax=Exophiala sideris TaxID=1016849 RepID=A0A0D1VTB9_9EURO|nr:hypothetical protein PV11_06938 [Exophiala sideris]